MIPAARILDLHVCPMVTGIVPHVGGPIIGPGAPTVLIGGMPAARASDMCVCVGPPDVIAIGAPTVLIGGMPAARLGDLTAHGGTIVLGCFTVLIGGPPASMLGALAAAIASAAVTTPPGVKLATAAASVNPDNSVINCGNIIDAVVARLRGTDPNAVAPAGRDGSWSQIESRMNTHIEWGHSFDDVYKAVRDGGNGTIAVVGIKYSGGTASHVVILANDNGKVGIVEGQNWGPGQGSGVISDPALANQRYNSDGGSNIGYGMVP